MNPTLRVKLSFDSKSNPQTVGPRNLRAKSETTDEKIRTLIEDLKAVLRYYEAMPRLLSGVLVDVEYNDIIAKSNRLQRLLKPKSKSVNDTVVGARFSDAPEGEENHIITHYVSVGTIERTIQELEATREVLCEKLGGRATPENFNSTLEHKVSFKGCFSSETAFRNLIVDCSVVEHFSVPSIKSAVDRDSFLVTFFQTEIRLENLLEKLGIDQRKYRYDFYGEDTISVTKSLFEILNEKVPYLISMVSSDLSRIELNDANANFGEEKMDIPKPDGEPVIGVIDTLFDESVYFANWVENKDYLDYGEELSAKEADREHGTQVTSIIVDGPTLNPDLNDGCGRFRVRHFGVCVNRISVPRLIRKVKEIVLQNPDIHVWNLSLGTEEEVSKNFISYDAAILDELQSDKNIIFVISGTNDNRDEKVGRLKIGSPADSLNSLVVNSVRRNGKPASYSRKGNVLSFFNKPDVSYYGGDFDERIVAYTSKKRGKEFVYGTSFAAPWISRKLSFLIDKVGLPKEVAKALIIDSAASWEYKKLPRELKEVIGYGVVPIKINEILRSKDDEIKLTIYGTSSSYRMTNYGIPVPKEEGKFPFVARAVLCYFPECSRRQGVDYTNRELSLKFGRIDDKNKINDINENKQDDGDSYITERTSRKEFRKWENTKLISKILGRNKPLKSYGDRLWGIAITSKERLRTKMEKEMNFGLVITLKEINGVNRFQKFVTACRMRGLIVNELNLEQQVELYNQSREEIILN